MTRDGKQHVIRLPNGRRCSVATYVSAWRQLKDLPASAQVEGFGHFSEDAAVILRQLRRGMHDRINRHICWHGLGRKWKSDWFWGTWRLADAVNTPRRIVRVSQVPAEFRERLAYRLTENSDF